MEVYTNMLSTILTAAMAVAPIAADGAAPPDSPMGPELPPAIVACDSVNLGHADRNRAGQTSQALPATFQRPVRSKTAALPPRSPDRPDLYCIVIDRGAVTPPRTQRTTAGDDGNPRESSHRLQNTGLLLMMLGAGLLWRLRRT